MASRAIDQGQSLNLALGLIPSLPRPMLARFVERAIERMDSEDGDPDLEEDDPPGGAVDDEGEPEIPDSEHHTHGDDQRVIYGHFGRVAWSHY